MILRIRITHPSTFEELATGVVDGGLHLTRWFAPSGLHEGGRRRPPPKGEPLLRRRRRRPGRRRRFRLRHARRFRFGHRRRLERWVHPIGNAKNEFFLDAKQTHNIKASELVYKWANRLDWPYKGGTSTERPAQRLYHSVDRSFEFVANVPVHKLGHLTRHVRVRLRRWSRSESRNRAYQAYRQGGGYATRWVAPWGAFSAADPLRLRRWWLRPAGGPFRARPLLGGPLPGAWRRLTHLVRLRRYRRVWRRHWRRRRQYRRPLFKRLARAVGRVRRRWLRLRRKRIRRRVGHPGSHPFCGLTMWDLPVWTLPRPALEEHHQSIGRSGYIQLLHTVVRERVKAGLMGPMEYTRYERNSQFEAQLRRRGRRYKPRDNPDWSYRLATVDKPRQEWLSGLPLQALASANRVDYKRRGTGEGPFNDPDRPPTQGGPFSWLYWNAVYWGKGSYWRDRPAGRALRTFIESIRSGWTIEADSAGAAGAAASTHTVRSTLLSEYELRRRRTILEVAPGLIVVVRVRGSHEESFNKPFSRPLTDQSKVSLRGRVSGFSRRVGLLFALVLVTVLTELKSVLYVPSRVVYHTWHRIVRWLHHYAVTHQGIRRWRWSYRAWLEAHNNRDLADETVNMECSTDRNFLEEDEIDVAGDYGEEMEGSGSYWEGIFPDDEAGWWSKDLTDYLGEANEVMEDLAFNELPYHVGLLVQPVVDLFARLPVWAVLDRVAWFVATAKAEWHLQWGSLLARGGRSARVCVLLRRSLHIALWLVVFLGVSGLITPDEINSFVVYTLGATFRGEYVVAWYLGSALATTLLVGPHPLRRYLLNEVGPEGLTFIFGAGTTLAEPEAYHPSRGWGRWTSQALHSTSGLRANEPQCGTATNGVRREANFGVDPNGVVLGKSGWWASPVGLGIEDYAYNFGRFNVTRPDIEVDRSRRWAQLVHTEFALYHRHPRYPRNNMGSYPMYHDWRFYREEWEWRFHDRTPHMDRNRRLHHQTPTRGVVGNPGVTPRRLGGQAW